MNYTDKDLIRTSQIAYLTINDVVLEQVRAAIEGLDIANPIAKANYTLSELFEYSEIFKRSVYKNIADMVGLEVDEVMDSDCKKDDILKRINDPVKKKMAEEKCEIIDEIKTGEIGSWKVVSYVDNKIIGKEGTAGKLVDGTWDHQNFSSSGDGLAAMVFETGTVKNYT